ncbi:pirin family protein [Parvibium lacunae]|uniref:Pirin family protein n=1 Tax=Parvibium lacunae TaxID=1888893 RepID=A0A368L4T6_9BURK|nr:pirin family protein [Parvibium lacunae]RCS58432.1 pirin family protein [Parvibium lacunae]
MQRVRLSAERGYADHGWLQSYHSFSFADYYDPAHMHFGALRVINEDWIAPGMGFPTHGHRDMEIITYVLEGELAHRDSMGNGSVITPGNVQRMSAGRGIQHSEFNHAKDRKTHLLQIWIQPNVRGGDPSYEEKHFTQAEKSGQWRVLAAPREVAAELGAVAIQAQAYLYGTYLEGDAMLSRPLAAGRRAYVHVARGELHVNGQALQAGDALLIGAETDIVLDQARAAEVLLFDLE